MKASILLLMLGFVAHTATAGEQPIVGQFKPLTTWEKIKLGAAYYTSPNVARDVDIAYEYDGKLWTLKQYEDDLNELASRRVVLCGKLEDKVIREIPCTTFKPQQSDNKIISSAPLLLGQKPEDILIVKDAYSSDGK